MEGKNKFEGFPKECITFFRDLKTNNNKQWFDHHKDEYIQYVKKPSESFVVAMGSLLKKFSPDIIAIPKTNKSLFRINRDTRFSMDKSPYKTNLGIYFWQAPFSKMESSGFYFHLEPPNVMIAAGIYAMPKPTLSLYRRAISDDKIRKSLMKILHKILHAGDYIIGGKTYKKIPAGYDPHCKNPEMLLYSSLYAFIELKIPPQFYTSDCIDWCYAHFKLMSPLHSWLVNLLQGTLTSN
jgi:uncharacterized protein (TIGR02453 family)